MTHTSNPALNTEVATMGGGCFWCLEAVFDNIKGVISVESGYAGGRTENPNYDDICTGNSGHAEVIKITFDHKIITYGELLDIFFVIHDPTTLNRQGNDRGTQYRSVIYYHSPEQHKLAKNAVLALNVSGIWSVPAVTEISPAPMFYIAENYHQEYFERNPNQPYCQAVVAPKVVKARKKFSDKLKN